MRKHKAARSSGAVRPIAPSRVNDGFANFVTRMGYGAGNSHSAGSFIRTRKARNWMELEAAYSSNWVAGAAVDAIAEDMTKAGIELTGVDAEDARKVQTAITSLGCWDKLGDAIRYGRLYGGAVVYIDIVGQDPSSELNPDTVRAGQFAGLRMYDRHMLMPSREVVQGGYADGTPEYYDLLENASYGFTAMRIHHSRIIRFVGQRLPLRMALEEELWGESILTRVWDRLLAYETSQAAVTNLLDKAYLRTVKIDGLRSIFASGDGSPAEANLMRSFDSMRALQSIEGLTLLDTKDALEYQPYQFAGLTDVVMSKAQEIAGALQIPLVRLLGQSPAGMNATGDSDWRNYYDGILARQETDMREGLTRLLRIAFRSTLGRSMDADCDFKFISLWQMTPAEKADIATKHATAVLQAHDAGLLSSAVAMRELRASSEITGIFSNITDEDIAEAENEPPEPEAIPPVPAVANVPAEQPAEPEVE